MTDLAVSIIIPTYNRCATLQRTLEAVERQAGLDASIEVIVVDDGSTDGTGQLVGRAWGFPLVYLRQIRGGATAARNRGAQAARGQTLVFMDDDIELQPGALPALVAARSRSPQTVVLGTLYGPQDLVSERGSRDNPAPVLAADVLVPVSYTHCLTGLLCMPAEDFFDLGMFQDPTGGWPNWDDIDFGYRAHQAGYRILRSLRARAIHHDLGNEDWERRKRRWYEASKSAPRLFRKYPDLRSEIPMFHDKAPVDWRSDPPRLIARKLLRQVSSSAIVVRALEGFRVRLEVYGSPRSLLVPLRRWIIGAYMLRGYRTGLADLEASR